MRKVFPGTVLPLI